MKIRQSLFGFIAFAFTLQLTFANPAPYPLERGEVVVTSASALDPNSANVTVIDVRPPYGPLGANWLAPRFQGTAWNVQNLGEVFGVCLDANDPPNIYVTATALYGPAAFGAGGSGGVYKIDGGSGAVSVFASLPTGSASLGNICYDAAHNQFFVSHLDNGLVYRLDANGAIISPAFDHGVSGRPNEGLPQILDTNPATSGLTPAGRRVWGLQVYKGRLYYAVWTVEPSNTPSSLANEIWSVEIDASGGFNLGSSANGGPRREISVPFFSNIYGSSPVSDIAFSNDGKMLLSERTVSPGSLGVAAHSSRVLEYQIAGSGWVNSGSKYLIGSYVTGAYPESSNSAGGADYDCHDGVIATGDALIHANGVEIYGLQILPPGGNAVSSLINTSYLIDLDGDTTAYTDKTRIGDVVVYREQCECEQIHCPSDKVVSCGMAWDFDSPVASGCTNYSVNFTTETNGICPTQITRTWNITDLAGNTLSSCSQTVTVEAPLTFLPATRVSGTVGVYASPSGNGQITATLGAGSGLSSAQNDSSIWNARFPILFPNANNNWTSDAQSVRVIGAGNFTISIDLTQFHNLSPNFVFGFYNIRDEGVYKAVAYDVNNAPIPLPLGWRQIGNDDDALHLQAANHLRLDSTTGIFSTQPYQVGVQSDALFWDHIPAGTARIEITGNLQQTSGNSDGVCVFFAETPKLALSCAMDQTVTLGDAWTFTEPTASSGCGDLTVSVLGTETTGACPQTVRRIWLASDGCGNSTTCTQTVVIQCVTNICVPVVSRVADLRVKCVGDSGATVHFNDPLVTSCCPGPYQFTYNPPAGVFPIGVTPVVGTVTDGCGNSAQFNFNVTVAGHGFLPVGQWAIHDGGKGPQRANAIAVDRFGDSYVAGAYVELGTFGAATFTTSILSDGFLAKYDTYGVPLWAVKMGGPRGDETFGVALDPQGNCFVTGVFFESATFYSAGGNGGVSVSGPGENDIFLAKYDPSGQLLWVTTAGGSADDSSVSVATDGSGNAYITGAFRSVANFQSAPPSLTTAAVSGSGIRDCFLAKYSPAGEVLWVDSSQGSGSYMAESRAVAVNVLGDAWIVGEFNGALQFGAGNPALGAFGNDNAFVARHSATLSPGWAWSRQTACGSNCGNHDGRAIGVDASGNCYFTAYYSGDVKLPSLAPVSASNGLNLYDCLVGSFGPNGNARWINNGLSHAATDQEPRGMAVTAAGDVFVTGFLNGTGGLYAADGQSVWLSRYSSLGANYWRREAVGHGDQHNRGNGVALDPAGCIYVTGAFDDSSLTFAGFATPPSLSAPDGLTDLFVAKYCPQCNNNALSIHVNSNPTSQIVSVGEKITLSVEAASDLPLTFEWRKNGVPIPNAAGADYTIPFFTADDVGVYTAVMSNDAVTIESERAVLMLPDSFSIKASPLGGLQIAWPPGGNWILEESENVVGPWKASDLHETPSFLPPSLASRFFRLRLP